MRGSTLSGTGLEVSRPRVSVAIGDDTFDDLPRSIVLSCPRGVPSCPAPGHRRCRAAPRQAARLSRLVWWSRLRNGAEVAAGTPSRPTEWWPADGRCAGL